MSDAPAYSPTPPTIPSPAASPRPSPPDWTRYVPVAVVAGAALILVTMVSAPSPDPAPWWRLDLSVERIASHPAHPGPRDD